MFWSQIFPFQVTCVLVLVASAAVMLTAIQMRWKRLRAAALITLLAAFAFIPSCIAVDAVTAPFRFRNFYYDDYSDVSDERFLDGLPPGAKEITIHNSRNGYIASFTVDREDLDAWYDDLLARTAGVVEHPGKPPIEMGPNKIKYEGPRAGNWAGLDVDYNPEFHFATVETADW